MRRSASFGLGIAILGCASAPSSKQAPPSAIATDASSSSTAAPIATAPPPDRVFTAGPPIAITKTKPSPKKKLIAKEAHFVAGSYDGSTFVAETIPGNFIYSPSKPAGAKIDPGVLIGGDFSSDGAFVAVWYQQTIEVFASPSGAKVLDDAAPNPCAFRWVSPAILLAQEGNVGTYIEGPQLYRVDAAAKTSKAIGPKRKSVDTCAIATDGSYVLVASYGDVKTGSEITKFDVATGKDTVLLHGVGKTSKDVIAMSPTADRICRTDGVAVWCLRVADGVTERIAKYDRPNDYGASGLEIESTGARMMIWGSEEKPNVGPTNTWDLVDFAAGTVRRLEGMTWGSGSIPKLFPEGRLFVVGSKAGITAIDLDAGAKTFVPNVPFYAQYVVGWRPRTIVGGAEPVGGGSLEDLYVFDVP